MKCTTHSLPHCKNRQFTLFYNELHVKCLPSCLMANHCLLWHRSKRFRIACGVESPCLWIPKILFVYPSILSVFIMYYMPNPFPECLCSHHTLSCCFKTYCFTNLELHYHHREWRVKLFPPVYDLISLVNLWSENLCEETEFLQSISLWHSCILPNAWVSYYCHYCFGREHWQPGFVSYFHGSLK